MPPRRMEDGPARSLATSGAVPLRVFTRVPLPGDLAEAIGAVLEVQERETDHMVRIALAIRIRRALEAWLDGRMTVEQVVVALGVGPDDPRRP